MHRVDFDDMPVSDIMRRWPATIAVFIELEFNCIGCPIGPFHTLAEAAEEHGLPLPILNERINQAINGTATSADLAPGHRRSRECDADRATAASAVRPPPGLQPPRR